MKREHFLLVLPLCVPASLWSASLTSEVTIPVPVAIPQPPSMTLDQITNTNAPVSLSNSLGSYSVSAFAQTDYGSLNVSAANYVGLASTFYGYNSGASSRVIESFLYQAGELQDSVSYVFNLTSSLTHNNSNSGGEELSFLASLISRPADGMGSYGSVSCGTSSTVPGSLVTSGTYGHSSNLNIPTSGTCTLQVPVTAGAISRLDLDISLTAYSLGLQAPSALSATVNYASTTPEPDAITLLGAGILGLLFVRMKKR